ncbi:DnaJ-like protein subfamily A member 2, partial [Pancytospora epiphaga]
MADDSKGYYKILGLSPGASIPEVKKAYKKKQVDLHPSGPVRRRMRESPEYQKMTGAQREAKEKELDEEISKANEAFGVLSIEEKKKDYDESRGQYGGFDMGAGGFGGFGDIFSHFTGGGRSQSRQYKVKDTVVDIKLTFKDAFLGKTNRYKVKTKKICQKCGGKGAEEIIKCNKCGGSGSVYVQRNLGMMVARSQVECPDCKGAGEKASGPICTECGGEKVVVCNDMVEVKIHAGICDGELINFMGKGNQLPGCENGNLVFKAVVMPSNEFSRNGDHLIGKITLDLLTALGGGVGYFDHVDGRKLAVKISPFKNFDDAICVSGEGFKGDYKRGDLYLKPNILMNSNMDRNKLSEYIKPLI